MAKEAKKATPKDDEVLIPKVTSDRHPRMLLIEFIGETPKLVFKGEWSVRNLLTIKRCISREFKLFRRSVIRDNIKETV